MNHFWHQARHAAIQRSKAAFDLERYISGEYTNGAPLCAKCGEAGANEVNHIKPLNGKRGPFGCCHHQSNLEALCQKCHKEETRRQWRAGEIGRPKADPCQSALL